MSKKLILIVPIFSVFFAFMNSPTFAFQAGSIIEGTGAVIVGAAQDLEADYTLTALCVGGQKAWYPPIILMDLRNQEVGGNPVQPILIKIKNTLALPQGFNLSADSAMAGPTSTNINLIIPSGETRFVGLPTSDLTFVTNGNGFTYRSQMDSHMQGGQLLILR